MDIVLSAIRSAILSAQDELRTIAAEEENARVYFDTLAKRRAKLEKEVEELTLHLTPKREEDSVG